MFLCAPGYIAPEGEISAEAVSAVPPRLVLVADCQESLPSGLLSNKDGATTASYEGASVEGALARPCTTLSTHTYMRPEPGVGRQGQGGGQQGTPARGLGRLTSSYPTISWLWFIDFDHLQTRCICILCFDPHNDPGKQN